MQIVTASQMRQVESLAVDAGISLDDLMENAGAAVVNQLEADFGPLEGGAVLVLVGRGNNGGDGLVVARLLQREGADVTAYLMSNVGSPAEKLELAIDAGVAIVRFVEDASQHKIRGLAASSTIIVDAVLGTGQNRHISPPLSGQLDHVRRGVASGDTPVVAIDTATGQNSDSGRMDPNGLPPSLIYQLGLPKVGLLRNPIVEPQSSAPVLDMGIPRGVDAGSNLSLMIQSEVAKWLPSRKAVSNKGSHGRVTIVAGSRNYVGAARLAIESAARMGAGLVTLATPEDVYRLIAPSFADAIYIPLGDGEAHDELMTSIGRAHAVLIGPGLSQSDAAEALLDDILTGSGTRLPPTIIDADGLNLLARIPNWHEAVPDRTIITPHPGEFSRLTGMSIPETQEDRIGYAQRFSAEWKKVIVLKGACTVVADPSGETRISPFANSGLATAGTGDVLAGMITGILGRGADPFDAASAGVYLHALAGELIRTELGPDSMLASDVMQMISEANLHLS
jgi:NAD(P)H-hydrate epimerase